MIDVTDEEVFRLVALLAEEIEEFQKGPRGPDYAREVLLRMWLHGAIKEGFGKCSPSMAILTATALDAHLDNLDGDAERLAKQLSAHLRHAVAAYESERRGLKQKYPH